MGDDISRKSTYIKRAGTEAWRWLSAEDSVINEDQPVGVSFYQRNSVKNNKNRQSDCSNLSQFLNQAYIKKLYATEQSYTSVNIEEPKDESVKKPEPAFEKMKNESDPNKRKSLQKLPSVLYDPEVRKQLQKMKRHVPYFMIGMTVIQIIVLVLSLITNYSVSKRVIADLGENPMLGPYPGVCIIQIFFFL